MPEPVVTKVPATDDEIDFSDLEAKYKTNPDDGFEAFVVVDGAPVIPEAKIEALSKVLRKLLTTVGTVKDLKMPVDGSSGKTKGFVFVEFSTPAEAAAAIKTYHGKKLDQKHTLLVNKLGDIRRYADVPAEYHEPKIEPYVHREYLRSWLLDQQGRDQMILHRGDEVGVFWNNRGQSAPEEVVNRVHWTEKYMRWSPKGNYLVSLHRQGLQLWSGPDFQLQARFAHPNVHLLDFSPNEKYLVTWSADPIMLPPLGSQERARVPFKEQDEGNSIVVWDLETNIPLRTFPMIKTKDHNPDKKVDWPMFKWTADSKFFARVIPGESLAVYETPSMGLLDKKTIKVPGIIDFEFAPELVKLDGRRYNAGEKGTPLLCYWTPELANQTARVSILDISTRQVIRSRNLFNVSGCRLHWQDQGRFLCVKVDRHTKTKKSTFTNLEFFRLTDKDIPVDVIELKETVMNFQWEPKSDRFVLISVLDQPAQANAPPPINSASFYGFERSKGRLGKWKLIKANDKKPSNSIYWSPKGRFVIVATVRPSGACEFEFWDFDHEGGADNREDDELVDVDANLQSIGTCEHYGMTDLEWDPSGRYVATSSSVWRHAIENGYKIWDFHGTLLREEGIDKFKAFQWRPRPEHILPKEKRKEINKNLKSYSRRFDEDDAMEQSEQSRQLILRRREALADWREWREEMEAVLAELGLPTDAELLGEHEGGEVVEEIREEILEEKEEIVE